jgi:O-antigen/teichoic acid export membrane protein
LLADRTDPAAAGPGRVGRAFVALGSGEVMGRLIAFAGTLYVARTLGPARYGVIGFALAILLYLQRIADAGFDLGVGVREVAAHRDALRSMVPALLTVRATIATLLACAAAALSLIFLPSPDGKVLALYCGALVAVGISTSWVHVGVEHPRRVASARVVGECVALGVLLIAVHGAGDVTIVPVAQVIGDGLTAVILLTILVRGGIVGRPRFDLRVALPLLRQGWRLMAASLFGLALYNSDLLFLRFFRGSVSVGYYAAAYTVVAFCLNVGIAYGLSLLPVLSACRADAGEHRKLFETALAHVFVFLIPVVVGGAVVAPSIVALVLGPTYAPAGDALRLLIWSLTPGVLCNVAVIGLLSVGREADVLRAFALTLAVVTVLDIVLISRFGIAGAAVATILGESVRLALTMYAAHRARIGGIVFGRLWRPLVAASAMAFVLLVLKPQTLAVAISCGAASYAVALVLTGAVRLRAGQIPVLSV